MISDVCGRAYLKTFSQGSYIMGIIGSNRHVAVKKEADGRETYYRCPDDETDETFLDRIERSKAAGRNLFFEEWKIEPSVYSNPDLVY